MANTIRYEYMNETSIDPELMCIICDSPFIDPVCTPCDHTFCRVCITKSINTRNTGCPLCSQELISPSDLVKANRTVRNMLDRLPIKCKCCGRTGMQRGNFDEHMNKECPKVPVQCPSADIKCPWEGPQDQLEKHVQTCVFQPFRSILTELIDENRQLKEQMEQQNAEIEQLKTMTGPSTDQLFSKYIEDLCAFASVYFRICH